MKLKIGNILICSSYILMAIMKMVMIDSNPFDSVDTQANMITAWAIILLIQLAGLILLGKGISNFNDLPAATRAKEFACGILMIIMLFINAFIRYDFFSTKMGLYSALALVIIVSVAIIIVSIKMNTHKSVKD